MAGDDQAMLDFNEILLGTQRKYDIIQTKWTEDKHFEIKFRTQIPRNSQDFNELCDEWVDIFSDVTNTVWVKKISNTGPKIRFRKQYQCWTRGGKTIRKELLFDARRCRATLDMKVLTDNPQTRKKNKHIKLGLNVVVKMNFTHLHTTDPSRRYAFFVHECEPQPEPPKPIVYPNDKLPDLVAKMVQRGLDFTAKANANPPQQMQTVPPPSPLHRPPEGLPTPPSEIIESSQNHLHHRPHLQHDMQHQQTVTNDQLLPNTTLTPPPANHLEVHSIESVGMQINQLVPLQNMDSIKLEVPQFQQVTQVLVSDGDIGEPVLFCQPTIMLDPSQVIPVSSHSFAPHFLQLHPPNLANQQGQYL
ncbi:hypothetical protein AMK59_4700 [Oryctes borbonicus]|uniref:Uncharacterized protein n=1 Tax=Oryctes borbonicus TaxID=1629725 RepID=A0A0T6B3V9_9SCAR|nr:hypothetical protein AMK59_4700 [Oryctes borbonicus]